MDKAISILMFSKKQKDDKEKKKSGEGNEIILEPTEEETGEENLRRKLRNLKEKLEVYSKEKSEYLAGWQRAKADYVNLNKEKEVERKESLERAARTILAEIIPVLDSFEVATGDKEAWQAVPEGFRQGMENIHKELVGIFTRRGGVEICPKREDEVNFHNHSVVGTVETDSKEKDGRVAEVIQKGYALKERVLRPASVKTFKFKNQS